MLTDRFFCEGINEYVGTFVYCPFEPSATKRPFFVKKGFFIPDASTNLNDSAWWDSQIAAGYVVPLPDGVFTDLAQNFQEGTVGIKTIKISDGESVVSYKSSMYVCLLNQVAKLNANNSMYDIFPVNELGQLLGKYDAENDAIYPLTVNSIDVRSKYIFSDGTDTEQVLDTVIIRYVESEAKRMKPFQLTDTIANITGLRPAVIGDISNDETTVTLTVLTACEGIAVDDLTDSTDFLIKVSETGVEIAITTVTPQGNGVYELDAVLTAATDYEISINGVGSNDESFTDSPVIYTAT